MTSKDMDRFQREINELIESVEAWLNSFTGRPGPEHVERLRGYEACAADIGRRIAATNSPAFADLAWRVTKIRTNLETVIRRATGELFAPLDTAIRACRDALANLEPYEKRAVVTLLMAEIAACEGDGL